MLCNFTRFLLLDGLKSLSTDDLKEFKGKKETEIASFKPSERGNSCFIMKI